MHKLVVRRLSFHYPGSGDFVFVDLDFTARSGQALWVSGRNGSGKTTLLEVVAGLRSCSSGSVELDGGAVNRLDVAYLPATLPLYDELDGVEHIHTFADLWGLSRFCRSRFIDAVVFLLEELGLRLDQKCVAEYSFGMREKLSFALTASLDTPLLLLDEPFRAMDVASRSRALSWLKENKADSIILYASHFSEIVDELASAELNLSANWI